MQAFLRGVLGPRPQLHFVFISVLEASTALTMRQAGACPDRQAKSGCHQGCTELSFCAMRREPVVSSALRGGVLHLAVEA